MTISEDNYTALLSPQQRRGADIRGHLSTIRAYADTCAYCVEMGVRDVVSTWSFLASKCKRITAIDCALMDEGHLVIAHKAAKEVGIDFEFVLGDTRELEIEPCDLLFIDTLHTYVQLVKELELHGNKARKYIIFHDTTKFGHRDEFTGRGPGLQPAIDEFLEANYHWKVLEVFTHNNGLTVLERRGEAPMIAVL